MSYKIIFDLTNRENNKITLLKDEIICDTQENFSDAVSTLEGLLKKHNLKISDIEFFESKDGEGSFTGIKVGATISNVLNWATGKISIDQIKLPIYPRDPNITLKKF